MLYENNEITMILNSKSKIQNENTLISPASFVKKRGDIWCIPTDS